MTSPAPRALGLLACTALVVGNMVGSGVFLLPASLAAFGPIAIAGWVVTSLGSIALALVFGRLATQVPRTGGPYAYTREAFGDFAGFLVAWGYWITLWAGNAGVAVAFTGYVGFFAPAVGTTPLLGLVVALAAIAVLTLVNIQGVGAAGAVQIVTTALKLVPLLAIAILGLAWIEPAHYRPVNVSALSWPAAVAATAALTLWAFLGLESATVPAGEVDRPETTIPRATVLGTSFAAVLYVLVTIVAMGLLPNDSLRGSTAPLADAAQVIWGGLAGAVVAAGAVVSTFGTLNGFTLLAGQVPYAAAQDGVFPRAFARRSRRGTPAFALIVSNLLAGLLVAMSFSRGLVDAFTFIILLATLAALLPYLLCAAADLMLMIRDPERVPAGAMPRLATIAAVAFVYAFGAIYGAGQEVVFWGFLLLLAGIPFYLAIQWQNRTPSVAGAPMSAAAVVD